LSRFRAGATHRPRETAVDSRKSGEKGTKGVGRAAEFKQSGQDGWWMPPFVAVKENLRKADGGGTTGYAHCDRLKEAEKGQAQN